MAAPDIEFTVRSYFQRIDTGQLSLLAQLAAPNYRFDMETTAVEPLQRIEGCAQGELQGIGCWTFDEAAGTTTVRYDWNVATTRAWMNLLAPLARPLFAWNHDVVMAWGRAGLLHLLGSGGFSRPIGD